jgi:hypothetical protein
MLGCEIGDEGIENLSESLKLNTSLTRIDLSRMSPVHVISREFHQRTRCRRVIECCDGE